MKVRPTRVPQPGTEEHAELPERPPIIAVMGHVNHGKTTLLDALRKTHAQDGEFSDAASKEAGGITQGVSAFDVHLLGDAAQRGTFIDTPGTRHSPRPRRLVTAPHRTAPPAIRCAAGRVQVTRSSRRCGRARRG